MAGTFVIGLIVAGIGSVVAKSPEQRDQIREADRVAQRFDASVTRYVTAAAEKLQAKHDADRDGYPALLKLADDTIKDAPRLRPAGTTSYGRTHSSDYQDAGERRSAALAPFRELEQYLRTRAVPDSKFIAAGKKLVALRPGTLLGKDPVLSGTPLRERVIPAYEKARDGLKKQDTPKGSELLQVDLMTYASDMISMSKDGAKKIDAQEAFFFQLGDRPVKLFRRLATMEAAIRLQVAQQVEIAAASQ